MNVGGFVRDIHSIHNEKLHPQVKEKHLFFVSPEKRTGSSQSIQCENAWHSINRLYIRLTKI